MQKKHLLLKLCIPICLQVDFEVLLLEELCLQNEFLILLLSRYEAKGELHIRLKIPSNVPHAAVVSEINLMVHSSSLPLNWANPKSMESRG